MTNKIVNEEDLKKVNGGEQQEKQYMCKKCGTIIDINTAQKKEVQIEGNLSASYQFAYWCPTCQDYEAIVPTNWDNPSIDNDQIKFSY